MDAVRQTLYDHARAKEETHAGTSVDFILVVKLIYNLFLFKIIVSHSLSLSLSLSFVDVQCWTFNVGSHFASEQNVCMSDTIKY